MKYAGMPWGMWTLFCRSFRKNLTDVYGYAPQTAKAITAKAKPKYKEIIGRLPAFETADRFQMNIVNCAMLLAFLLNLPQRPTVEQTTEYYRPSMMTAPMRPAKAGSSEREKLCPKSALLLPNGRSGVCTTAKPVW